MSSFEDHLRSMILKGLVIARTNFISKKMHLLYETRKEVQLKRLKI